AFPIWSVRVDLALIVLLESSAADAEGWQLIVFSLSKREMAPRRVTVC
ncbi:MAG: hypothetical protein ACI814_004120, partial [Mariniblastus sp.]